MSTETNELTLDLERCHKIQEIINLVEQLMAAENRPRAEYITIRYKILDAADQLYSASMIYLETIEQHQLEN